MDGPRCAVAKLGWKVKVHTDEVVVGERIDSVGVWYIIEFSI